jgi:hypothetical protein
METNLALFALGFALGLAVGFGRPCRVIAERVHAGEEDIQKYEFKKWGPPWGKTAAPNKRRQFRG